MSVALSIASPALAATPSEATRFVAPPAVAAEIRAAIETARAGFEARDAAAVLASVSEQFRSGGLTKPALRQQLLAMFGLYEQLRARVRVDRVEIADGRTEVFTTGEVSGRLPLVGWVPVLSWNTQPEVVRREGDVWRLFGFQD
ncbi:MAG TPA: hypothetical protein VEA38_08085 [Terriglobales bacterium]|nr:hypothetical protein [Terriglobales bacterium]